MFNELLVQYPLPGQKKLGQVVPDNMVVLHDGPIDAQLSFSLPLVQPGPFWILEYVSKHSRQKDYVDNLRRYEQDLKVPYYLLFDCDTKALSLYRHDGEKYQPASPNANGRLAIAELDVEVAIRDGWVRFWHQGTLLALPADLQRELDHTREQLNEMTQRAQSAEREAAELRIQLEQLTKNKNGSS